MIVNRLVLLIALVAGPGTLGSAIKGYAAPPIQQHAETKSLKSPIEHQRHLADLQTKEGSHHLEQQREEIRAEQQKLEELPRQDEIKGTRYEARPQIREEAAPTKTLKLEQHREELTKASPPKIEERIEQQRELKQELLDTQQQQVELQTAQIQEEYHEQQKISTGTKSLQPEAPLGEAEPYSFSYSVDGSSRTESGDTKGTVRGQYTLQGPDGSQRIVDYIADRSGFRASVNTNEFGTEGRSPANVALRSSQPEAQDITLRLEGKTREDLLPPPATKIAPVPAKPDNWIAPVKGAVPIASIAQAPIAQAALPEIPSQQIEEDARPIDISLKKPLLAVETSIKRREEKALPLKSLETIRQPTKQLELAHQAPLTRGFESATAHRTYAAPVAPVAAVRRQPSLIRLPEPPVLRNQLQRDRLLQPVTRSKEPRLYADFHDNFDEEDN